MAKEREHLNFVIVGHIDHGKSTLIGRLLYDTDSIPESIIDDVRVTSEAIGKKMEFAYLLDSLKEEREQNITIDTTQTFFKSEKRDYIIIDAPGHKEFLKNMITGASLANAAILMVDSSVGIQEQSRRHAFILSLLGVKQIIVAINKMDLVDYRQDVYDKLNKEVTDFLAKINLKPNYVIPVSAQEGDNVVSHSSNMPWYNGVDVLEALDSFEPSASLDKKSLRFPIQDVYNIDDKKIFVGKLESGSLKKGDGVFVLPSNTKATIKNIEVWKQIKNKASTGDSIGLTFNEDVNFKRGDIVCEGNLANVSDTLEATVFWMDAKDYEPNEKLILKCVTQEVPCEITQIESRIDSSTLDVIDGDNSIMKTTEAAKLKIKTESPIVTEDFNNIEGLGRFVFARENGDIVASGIFGN